MSSAPFVSHFIVYVGRRRTGMYGQYTTFADAMRGANEYARAWPGRHVEVWGCRRGEDDRRLVCTVQEGSHPIDALAR